MKTITFKITGFLLLIFFINCGSRISEKEETLNKIEKQTNSNIIGAWGNEVNENAIFSFYSDSIYYLDPNKSYKYEIFGDTIRIYKESNFIERIIIRKLDSDSLVLEYLDYDIIGSFVRMK